MRSCSETTWQVIWSNTLRERLAAAEEAVPTTRVSTTSFTWQRPCGGVRSKTKRCNSMANVAKQLPDDLGVRFDMAQMYESRGDYEDALLLIDSVTPRDQKVLQQRELAALQIG